jgi:hypothetical protein
MFTHDARMDGGVDRCTRFDAERAAAAYADHLQNEVDIDTIASDLRATIDGAIAPTRFALWLRVGSAVK